MSVLLEALKKAAEEKSKLAAKEKSESGAPDSETSASEKNRVSLLAKDKAVSPEEETVINDAGEDSPNQPAGSSSVSLKLEPSLQTQDSQNRDIDELLPEEESESKAPISKSKTISKEDKPGSEEEFELEQRSKLSAGVSLSLNPSHKDELRAGTEEASTESNKIETPESEVKEDSVEKNSSDIKSQEIKETASTQSQDQEKRVEDDDSYEWSLEQLPAYVPEKSESHTVTGVDAEGFEKDQALAKNSVLTTNAHSKPYTLKESKLSLNVISATAFFAVLIVIGLYTVFYFNQQNHLLEASFDKYKITPVIVDLPKSQAGKEKSVDTDLSDPEEEGSTKVIAEEGSSMEMEKGGKALPSQDSKSVATEVSKHAEPRTVRASSAKPTVRSTNQTVEQKVKPLRSNDKVLVMNTVNSTVLQPRPTSISKSKALTVQQQKMAQAYELYEQRQWQESQNAFKQVLEKDPVNLNALLGIAATHNVQGNRSEAIQTYQKILTNYPGNPFALEALSEIANTETAPSREWFQQLTELAKKNPRSSVLQNALGNLMAKQRNWYKAQEYYFNAVSMNENESIYLMNLAVSLDHLNKYKLAAEYYTKALIHAQDGKAIDESAIKRRIAILRQHSLAGD